MTAAKGQAQHSLVRNHNAQKVSATIAQQSCRTCWHEVVDGEGDLGALNVAKGIEMMNFFLMILSPDSRWLHHVKHLRMKASGHKHIFTPTHRHFKAAGATGYR